MVLNGKMMEKRKLAWSATQPGRPRSGMRVAILGSDMATVEHTGQILASSGHVCHLFTSGRALLKTLTRETFSLLLLDQTATEIADMPGATVLQWVQKHVSPSPPVIFLSSHATEADIVTLLNEGADDYIVKPQSPGLLLARVESTIRRGYSFAFHSYTDDSPRLKFDPVSMEFSARGIPVDLTPREFDLAWLLFLHLGRAVSRGHILDMVWTNQPDVQPRVVDRYVSKLRSKLEGTGNSLKLLAVSGQGYRLESSEYTRAGRG
jgi:DNA-binding response OmpR family regulator